MNIKQIAIDLIDTANSIILIYAFNSSGKTRLSVAYKDWTKAINGDKPIEQLNIPKSVGNPARSSVNRLKSLNLKNKASTPICGQ